MATLSNYEHHGSALGSSGKSENSKSQAISSSFIDSSFQLICIDLIFMSIKQSTGMAVVSNIEQ